MNYQEQEKANSTEVYYVGEPMWILTKKNTVLVRTNINLHNGLDNHNFMIIGNINLTVKYGLWVSNSYIVDEEGFVCVAITNTSPDKYQLVEQTVLGKIVFL